MQQPIKIKENNQNDVTLTTIRNLDYFLELFDGRSVSCYQHQGKVISQNEAILGIFHIYNKEMLQARFSSSYGNVTVKTLPGTSKALSFSIKEKGKLSAYATGSFFTDLSSLEKPKKGIIINLKKGSHLKQSYNICFDDYFRYQDHEKQEQYAFNTIAYLSGETGISFEMKRQDKNRKQYVSVSADTKEKEIYEACDWDFIHPKAVVNNKDLIEHLDKELSVWQQMNHAISFLDQDIYEYISQIVTSCNRKNGSNIIEQALRKIAIPQMTEEQSLCIFGPKLQKKLSSKNKV